MDTEPGIKRKILEENFRRLLVRAGATIDEKVFGVWSKYSDVISKLEVLSDTEDAIAIYTKLKFRFGTATKRKLIAEEGNILVDGDFVIGQESSSSFYYGFDSGKPCVLKFNESASVAVREMSVYNEFLLAVPAAREYLVNIQLVKFCQDQLMLPRHVALKMQIYVHTLASIPHTTRLADYYDVQMRRILEAIQAIHISGHVHCDVKPSNIFVDVDGLCYLGDYDSVRKIGADVDRTTQLYVPREFLSLERSKKFQASIGLDYAMTATTFYFAVTESPHLQIDDITRWCEKEENSGYNIVRLLSDCVNRVTADEYYRLGSLLNSEAKPRTVITNSPPIDGK